MEYFVKTFENTVRRCWNSPALDEYRTSSETYGQLASDIEKIHRDCREMSNNYATN